MFSAWAKPLVFKEEGKLCILLDVLPSLSMNKKQQPLQDLHRESVKKMAALEGWLEPIFTKAPHLPRNIQETLVQIAPWLALIFGVLGIASILSAGMFMPYVMSFGWVGGGAMKVAMGLGVIATLLASVLSLLAWQPLNARKKLGWDYLFYGTVLTAVSAILNLFFGYATVGSVLGAVIGFWLLFEIRSFYRA
jgi:hypothetical protein